MAFHERPRRHEKTLAELKSGFAYDQIPTRDWQANTAWQKLNLLAHNINVKHASWLNMVEIEIGVMVAQCLARRIPDKATLVSEVVSWEKRRNAERARINRMFTVERARVKLGRAYPQPADQPIRAAA